MKYPQLVSMPSAVSDWLEEQLEARGIDAVVYTRYVLSLLHRDTVDLVSSDQDIQLPKDVRQSQRQSSGGRKRFRRSAEWWSHVRADVEQLRRSAAVECLMSAADQKCGIESLVDELCEKLKHFESSSNNSVPTSEVNNAGHESSLSPTDLARRYYAAFPPLSKSASANLITLIANTKRRHRRPRHSSETENMKSRAGGKRLTYFTRNKRDFGFARSLEKSSEVMSDWDKYFVNQNRTGDEGYSTSDTTGVDDSEDISEISPADSSKNKNIDENHLAKLVAKFDRKIEALWNDESCLEQNNKNEYQDLPIDIQELLATPTKDKPKTFIQCGTNIISSIWTECSDDEKSLYDSNNFCNLYNETLESYPEKILGDQFNSLSMATDKLVAENETNLLLEKNEFASLPWELAFPRSFGSKKWSDGDNFSFYSPLDIPKNVNRAVNDSLLTLNHNKEASCFREVIPKQILGLSVFSTESKPETRPDNQESATTKEEEDLLTSTRTHFRPIKQENLDTNVTAGQYADGTTFTIRSSLEHVNYRRSESGTLYLESGFDSPKKYMEYRLNESSIEREFVLKFCVKQNEKCCQTEIESESSSQSQSPLEVPAKKRVLCDPDEFFFPGDEELLSDTIDNNSCECSCSRSRAKLATSLEPLFNASSEFCSLHGNRPDSISWNSNWKKCDKCNNNWPIAWTKSRVDEWRNDAQSLQQIWSSSEELCRSCLAAPAGSGPPGGRSLEYFKLREELSEDGEQLLSDLSCLQRVYMEQLPNAEISYDLNEPGAVASAKKVTIAMSVSTSGGNKERKRRHSSSQRSFEPTAMTVARNSWTNASCQRNFLTPPLLRPVTL